MIKLLTFISYLILHLLLTFYKLIAGNKDQVISFVLNN